MYTAIDMGKSMWVDYYQTDGYQSQWTKENRGLLIGQHQSEDKSTGDKARL